MKYTTVDKGELDKIIGMANISPKTHKFGVNVNLNLLQPGDKKLPHYARVKVYKKDKEFEVALNPDPSKMVIIGKPFLRGKDLRATVKAIKKYRQAFIMFWQDSKMTTDRLRELMDKVDSGELK